MSVIRNAGIDCIVGVQMARFRRSIAEIAEVEKIDRSFVSRLLDLTLLAPDLQEAIFEGRQPKGMQLEELIRVVPGVWEEQRLLARPESGDANSSKR